LNPTTRERRFGEFVYDGCNGDAQLFPIAADPRYGSCNNDDSLFPSAKYSLCPTLPGGSVPAGLPFDQSCMALAETAVSLHADAAHDPADTTNTYTVTTSFTDDFQRRLSDATCTDVITWQVTAWELQWPDGTVDAKPGSAQQGTTDSHQLPPAQHPDPQTVRVIARAHLHITARAVDFDANANTFVRSVSADVVISNDASAAQAGLGGVPVYTPPVLRAAAICEMQEFDGTLQPYRPNDPLVTACQVLRGRLDQVYPQVQVLRPGQELVAGVSIGDARSVLTSWTYTGGLTDAPARTSTGPGATGALGDPVDVQWNHASRIDESHGQPTAIPEQVPLGGSVTTTYPDGHVETERVTGSIAVTIFYVGLNA
jgi:hypothetical protein